MSKIKEFTPSALLHEDNIEAFIKYSKETLWCINEDGGWEENSWYIDDLPWGNAIHFFQGEKFGGRSLLYDKKPYGQAFHNFLKAIVNYGAIMKGWKPYKFQEVCNCLRFVEFTLRGRAAVDKSMIYLTADDIDTLVVTASDYYKGGHFNSTMVDVFHVLHDSRLISTSLRWPSERFIEVDDREKLGDEGLESARSKMADLEDILNLGHVFWQTTQEGNPGLIGNDSLTKYSDADEYVTNVFAFLCSSPNRIGEILGLTVDCLVDDTTSGGEEALLLKTFVEKKRKFIEKPVYDCMHSPIKEAHRRALKASEHARWLAAWLEDHPDKFPRHANCPDVGEDDELTSKQYAQAMGISIYRKGSWTGTPIPKRFQNHCTLRKLNAYIHTKKPKCWPNVAKNMPVPMRHAIFSRLKYQNSTTMETSPVILGSVRQVFTSNWIGNINGGVMKFKEVEGGQDENWAAGTIWKRFGIVRQDGNKPRMNTHSIRHFLDNLNAMAGLSQIERAFVAGRNDIRQNNTYDWRNEEFFIERADQFGLQQVAKFNQETEGILHRISRQLPVTINEAKIAAESSEITPWGNCARTVQSLPCTTLNCMNCMNFFNVKGACPKNEGKLDDLIEKTGEKLKKAYEMGISEEHPQVQADARTLLNAIKLRILQESTDIPKYSALQVPMEDKSPLARVNNSLAAKPNKKITEKATDGVKKAMELATSGENLMRRRRKR